MRSTLKKVLLPVLTAKVCPSVSKFSFITVASRNGLHLKAFKPQFSLLTNVKSASFASIILIYFSIFPTHSPIHMILSIKYYSQMINSTFKGVI